MNDHKISSHDLKKNLLGLAIFCYCSLASSNTWYRSGANDASTKFSDINQITHANINDLSRSWVYKSGYIPFSKDTVQTNPIFTGQSLITTSLDGRVISLNPENGKMIWHRYLPTPVGRRGITYQLSKIYVPTGSGIHALDVTTGKILQVYGSELSFLPPVVTKDMLISADLVSGISAYHLNNGKKKWHIDLQKNGVLPRLWSGLSYDEESRMAFVVTSNTGYLDSGSHQSGEYSNSVLAINTNTGTIEWQFQEIKNDLWDLDMVGPPILLTLLVNKKPTKCLVAVSKSGYTIILNRQSGKLLNDFDVIEVSGNRFFSIKTPPPLSLTELRINDITKLSNEKKQYVMHKIRGSDITPHKEVSYNKSVALFGLHGGAEWPGAAADVTTGIMVVPSNKYPWIIRKYRINGSSIQPEKYLLDNKLYTQKCAVCHQSNLTGLIQDEMQGDAFIPPLTGITLQKDQAEFSSVINFNQTHKYAWHQLKLYVKTSQDSQNISRAEPLIDSLKKLQRYFNTNLFNSLIKFLSREFSSASAIPSFTEHELDDISNQDLNSLYLKLKDIDSEIAKNGGFKNFTGWQLLLDPNLLPGSNPPWGLLTAIDLNSRTQLWQIPFGNEVDRGTGKEYPGARNFGGAIITKSSLVFASGTTDKYARAFDLKSGKELWSEALPFSGSAPPMTYIFKGCQYVIFTATGGRFVGFDERGDETIAFKLKSCLTK